MAQKSAVVSFRAEREFGLLVGGMLILIGSWWLFRGKFHNVTTVIITIGTLLVILGMLFPRGLAVPNRLWMQLAHLISLVTTPIILGLVYFLLFMPIGVVRRMAGWDPLRRRAKSSSSYWQEYNSRQRDPHHFEKMY